MPDTVAPPPAVPALSPFVFFRATRSFRSPKVLVTTIVAVVIAARLWWLLFLHKRPGIASNQATMILGAVATLLAIVGLRRVLTGETWELVISTEGVRYGAESWEWNQIRAIS